MATVRHRRASVVSPVGRRLLGAVPPSAQRHIPAELQADARVWLGRRQPGDIGYVPEPPHPTVGERTGPPDFVTLGSVDAGGEWWMSRVADHPEVAPNRTLVEAAHFFASYCTDAFGPHDVARFHALFPRRPGRVIGHWSPDGLSYPWVAPLLVEAAPRAHLLVLVRDPVERLRSGLVRTEPTRAPHVGTDVADAVDRGYYADHLVRLLRWFPKSQVRVIQMERCLVDPEGALAQTYDFLGLDDTYRARALAPPSEPVREPLSPVTRQRLVDMYAADVASLGELLPDLDLSLWPNFARPG
jgi:hypothetical protein